MEESDFHLPTTLGECRICVSVLSLVMVVNLVVADGQFIVTLGTFPGSVCGLLVVMLR